MTSLGSKTNESSIQAPTVRFPSTKGDNIPKNPLPVSLNLQGMPTFPEDFVQDESFQFSFEQMAKAFMHIKIKYNFKREVL